MATNACKKNAVLVHQIEVKPHKMLSGGETIHVKKGPIWRSYRVLSFPQSRVGAPKVSQYIEEVTLPEELAKLKDSLSSI